MFVSMGYSLQRPRARPLSIGNGERRDKKFQWATHFNAHAHQRILLSPRSVSQYASFNGLLTSTPTRTFSDTFNERDCSVSMGYSLQRPRAPDDDGGVGPRPREEVSMGYSLQLPRALMFFSLSRRTRPKEFQWATHFNAHAHISRSS